MLEESLEYSLLYINFSNKKGNGEVLCKSNYPHYPWKNIDKRVLEMDGDAGFKTLECI